MRKKLWLLMVIIFVAAIADKLLSPRTVVDKSLLVDSSALVTMPPDKININISSEPIFSEYQTDRFVAHRGFSDHAPENSIPAFEAIDAVFVIAVAISWVSEAVIAANSE